MFLLLLLLLFERNFWIQTCNFNLFFLCTWQNKTYLLSNIYRKDFSSLYFNNNPWVQEKQQKKDQQSCRLSNISK